MAFLQAMGPRSAHCARIGEVGEDTALESTMVFVLVLFLYVSIYAPMMSVTSLQPLGGHAPKLSES